MMMTIVCKCLCHVFFVAGLGLSNTNYARVLETLCTDPAIAVTLMAHQSIGLKVGKAIGLEYQYNAMII
jgi:hypothetical protein